MRHISTITREEFIELAKTAFKGAFNYNNDWRVEKITDNIQQLICPNTTTYFQIEFNPLDFRMSEEGKFVHFNMAQIISIYKKMEQLKFITTSLR